jgi:hypothetical protein
MHPKAEVIGAVHSQQTSEVIFMQRDDMVKEVTADTPDESFHVRILPGALGAITTSSMPMCRTRCRKNGP